MPAVLGAVAKMGLTIDHATHTIRLVRDFTAPSAQIFQAWTQPEQIACWWDPSGEPLVECEIDLRPGGAFKFVTRAHPEMPFAGTYREIVRPDRLVFDALGSTGRVLFEESAGETRMIVEIECRSADHLAQFLKMGVDVGTAQTLDNLVAYARSRWG
ncbi:MAG: Activator of Hsp90 ATPase 1 family protein [Caulobacteraceae bacterium]|nr:Activator of Hsp90 ATPase 1 family protein [Caulobacteraceae bacterium]